jgi:hypothetical protein
LMLFRISHRMICHELLSNSKSRTAHTCPGTA